MALDGTYEGLKISIAQWLNRDDLVDLIPDFIAMAEIRLNDRLRLAPMETRTTLTLAGSSTHDTLTDEETSSVLTDESTSSVLTDEAITSDGQLPDDFLEARVVTANTSPALTLRLASPTRGPDIYGTLSSTYPDVYTIVGNTITTYPGTSATIDLIYYARIPALSDSNPSNWLLVKYPQIYLYASLLEAMPLLMDDQRTLLWNAALDKAIEDAGRADQGLRWGGAGLRLIGPTP